MNPDRFVPLSVRQSRIASWLWVHLPYSWLSYEQGTWLARRLP